jgi:hypothetical protein
MVGRGQTTQCEPPLIRAIITSAHVRGPFMELGTTQHAMDFIRLDAGSERATYAMTSLLLREGKVAEAKQSVQRIPTVASLLPGSFPGMPLQGRHRHLTGSPINQTFRETVDQPLQRVL